MCDQPGAGQGLSGRFYLVTQELRKKYTKFDFAKIEPKLSKMKENYTQITLGIIFVSASLLLDTLGAKICKTRTSADSEYLRSCCVTKYKSPESLCPGPGRSQVWPAAPGSEDCCPRQHKGAKLRPAARPAVAGPASTRSPASFANFAKAR